MADVFVSYRRDDKRDVGRIVEALRSAGFSVWWDADIAAQAPWEATIEEQLGSARAVIVAWSKVSVASENVKAEARRARDSGRLVQVYLDKCDPPLFFGERQGIDLSLWSGSQDEHSFEALVRSVSALSEKTPTPTDQLQVPAHAHRSLRAWLAILLVLIVVALSVWIVRGAGVDSESRERSRVLSAIEGSWGRPGCPSPQEFSVAAGEITVRAGDWRSTGRVVSVERGAVLTETLTPVADRGRLIELRPQGDQLVFHDRTTDVRQVLERCP